MANASRSRFLLPNAGKTAAVAGVMFLLMMVVARGMAAVKVWVCGTDSDLLMPCEASVKPWPSKPPAQPAQECCSVLRDPLTNVTCLCYFANTHPLILRVIGVNPDLAKALPAKCNMETPSECLKPT